MKPRISETDFAALVARTGIALSPAERQDIFDVFGLIEAMQDRIHAPLPREAEPALTFRPDEAA